MESGVHMLALSVRQPYAELIISGQKRQENRSRATRIRGPIYIYATKNPPTARSQGWDYQEFLGLPRGYLVGIVEVSDCVRTESGFAWVLQNPSRLSLPLKPTKQPQPVWFYPF